VLWNSIGQDEAMAACANMYKSSAVVDSHLMYDTEYDRALQWLIDTGNKTMDDIVTDSTDWGNYDNSDFPGALVGYSGLINTGSTEYTKANNIYDLAGNLFEWTQSNARGGSYNRDGDSFPAGRSGRKQN